MRRSSSADARRAFSRFCCLVGMVLLSLPFTVTVSRADDKADFDAAALFRSSCAPCHGLRGEGDGPVASTLNVRLKPLSGLSAAHGGTFPADYVTGTIDGRIDVDAHGPRQMPVWGRYFVITQESGDGSKPALQARESNVDSVVKPLVHYIQSLQKSP